MSAAVAFITAGINPDSMISASLTDLVEYTLHALGIGMMMIWLLSIILAFEKEQFQLGVVLLLLFVAVILSWLYHLADDIL